MIRVMYKVLYSCLLLLLFSSCNKNLPESTVSRIDTLLAASLDSLKYNPEYSFVKLKEAERICPDSGYYYRIKDYLTGYYLSVGKQDSAILLVRNVINYAIRNPEIEQYDETLMSGYNSIGIYFSQFNNLDSALAYYYKSYKHALRIRNNKKIIDICINIADMSTRKGDFLNGIAYFRKALVQSDSLKIDEAIKFPIYFGLGQAYYAGLRNFDLSDTYFRKAERLYEGRNLSEKFVFCNNRGNFYYYKEDYVNALSWFIKAKKLVEPLNIDFYTYLCYGNLGDVYLHLNKLDSANYYLLKSYEYFESTPNETVLFYLATARADLALSAGNSNQANLLLQRHKITKGIEPEILGLRYKVLQKYYTQISNYQQALIYETKYVRLNDSLRSERIKNSIAEIDARYMQDTTIMRKEFLIRSQNIELEELRLTKWFWVSLSLTALFIALAVYLFFKRKKDLQQARHLEVISRYRLQNIRNRISPHFIFNVLNRQIDNKEVDEQQDTIELVRLLRKSLEMTEKIAIPLGDEISFVKSYINIEQRSFVNGFIVNWSIDSSLNLDKWKIPAMIMQIPIENAIKHGLKSISGDKILSIELKEITNALIIIIRDNGDGYNTKKMTESKGTGTGLKVLYTTIQILNNKNKEKIEFNIEKLEAVDSSGTRVCIVIPENYLFDI